MKTKKLNSAQDLLAHIALKTKPIAMFGASMLVKQWTANERIKLMAMIEAFEKDATNDVELVRPQAQILAMSLVDDKGNKIFPTKWKEKQLIFDDPDSVETLIQCGVEQASQAFVAVAEFNGVYFGKPDNEETPEDKATKN